MQVWGKRITADITDAVASQRRALARTSQRSSDRDTYTIRKFEDYHDKTSVYAICQYCQYTGWAKKWVDRLMVTILSNHVITVRVLGKFAAVIVKNFTAPCICCYTILWNITVSAKQAINDKLQGSVSTYLRCDGVVNNQIRKGLLLSLSVKNV